MDYVSDGDIALTEFVLEDVQAILLGDRDLEHRRRFEFPDSFLPTLEHAAQTLLRWNENRAAGPQYTYAIRESANGLLLGGCELRATAPSRAQLSYWVYAAFRRRGVARRAVALAIVLAREIHLFERIDAWIDRDNTASRTVVFKNGFCSEGVDPRQEMFSLIVQP